MLWCTLPFSSGIFLLAAAPRFFPHKCRREYQNGLRWWSPSAEVWRVRKEMTVVFKPMAKVSVKYYPPWVLLSQAHSYTFLLLTNPTYINPIGIHMYGIFTYIYLTKKTNKCRQIYRSHGSYRNITPWGLSFFTVHLFVFPASKVLYSVRSSNCKGSCMQLYDNHMIHTIYNDTTVCILYIYIINMILFDSKRLLIISFLPSYRNLMIFCTN